MFCGSSSGSSPGIAEAAVELGEALVQRNIGLVYGGGAVGLMGVIADTVMSSGGRVTGVIPHGLFSDEVGHSGITRLERVGSMHERKQRMHALADGFIALPGGLGTLEELSEALSWNRIGLLDKPVGIVDVDGYWEPLLAQLDRMVDERLLSGQGRRLLLHAPSPTALLDLLERAAAQTRT